MTEADAENVARALQLLDVAILVLKAAALAMLASAVYAVWWWHRSPWK